MNVEERTRSSQQTVENSRRVARALISLGVAIVLCIVLWRHIGTTLHGKTDVVGYPLFADFNVNRYLDAFYLAAIVGPLVGLCIFAFLSRFGPLRRTTPKRRFLREGQVLDGDEIDVGDVALPIIIRVARLIAVGAILGLEVQTGFDLVSANALAIMTVAALGFVALVVSLSLLFKYATHRGVTWTTVASQMNSLAVIAMVPLLYQVSRATKILVISTHRIVHYPWLPLWSVIVVTALLIAYVAHRRVRINHSDEKIEHNLIFFVAIPIAIFLVYAGIPGALGPMDPFGEGEFLAGGWLLMHGVVPWRDLYLIHGIFDDGFKGIIGFQVFGRTRWGATTGMTMLLIPLYWVFTYYLAAVVFIRRPLFVISCAAAVVLGVFVNWDLRFMLWPLVLILFYRVLQQRTPGRVIALVAALIVEAIIIPEMSYALVACGATLVAYEIYERHGLPLAVGDLRATIWSIISSVIIGGAFVGWLAYEGAISGFIGYFKDFANAHSLTGGIPLYTTYAVAVFPNVFGITLHATQSPPIFTRYGLELLLPVAAIVATIGLVVVRVRSGYRLVTQDWLCVATAILVALYYQKAVSRADTGHIAEVFEVTVPLLILLAYRFLIGLEVLLHRLHAIARAHQLFDRAKTSVGLGTVASPVTLVVLIVLVILAPTSLAGLFNPVPSHYEAAVASPAPPAPVKGGPGLGYNVDALPPGVLTDIGRVFDRYAGATGAVFDFSNSPAVVNFLLNRKPTSRFYDVGDITTISAQQDTISDLERTKPLVVLFNGVGMGAWDFIPNEIRDGVLSDWLLSNYRPFVLADGQMMLLRDTVTHPKPLPKLVGPVRTKSLYYRLGKCQWGYIPNYLDNTIPAGALEASVALKRITTTKTGTIYKFIAPTQLKAFHWVSVTTTGALGDVGLSISDVGRVSNRDISWVAQGSGTTDVEAASCIQWHGFGRVLYLRYLGTGTPTSIQLIG